MTHPSYFEDTYKFTDSARMTKASKDEQGNFIVLDQTIFYPQGGGQPSDQGIFQIGDTSIPIHSIKSIDQEIRHYTHQDARDFLGQKGLCILDQEKRLLHARLHTAGHLISNVVENHYPQWMAIKGHHFPEQCYVEFTIKNEAAGNISIEGINEEIEQFIGHNLVINRDQITGDKLQELCPNITYTIPKDQPIRVIRIGDFSFSPCGGTHVKNLQELKGLKITNSKIKKNNMKVYYDIH